MKMNKIVVALSLVVGAHSVFAATSATATASAPALSDAQVQAVIQKLESSGALDAAIARGVDKYVQTRQDEQKKQQEAEMMKQQARARKAAPVSAKDHIEGDAKAEMSVIVYSDPECPYCKRFDGNAEEAAKAMGGTNSVLRVMPLEELHGAKAVQEALIAQCVGDQYGNTAFFKVWHGILQGTQANGQGMPQGDAQLRSLVQSAGANWDKVQSCVNAPQTTKELAAVAADAKQAGIYGTPGVLVRNNRTGATVALPGAVPAADVEQALRLVRHAE